MNSSTFRSTRGSSLAVVLIFSGVLIIIIGSMIRWVTSERRMNQRAALRLEVRNAAEAAAEWGFYQVRNYCQSASSFTTTMFCPGGLKALTTPTSAWFTGGHVDTSSGAMEVFGGVTPAQSAKLIDANDPNNLSDPLKGKYVFTRDIPIYAKATVSQAIAGPPVYAYVKEVISIRGAPLFAHAIFYNMDLELTPTGTMNISGPVHANGNIYAISTGTSLNFLSTVTCTGNFYHSSKYISTTTAGIGPTGWNGSATTSLNAPVTIANASGTSVSLYQQESGAPYNETATTWHDSTMGRSMGPTAGTSINSGQIYASQTAYQTALTNGANTANTSFRAYASQKWGGNFLTGAMGVQNYTPAAIGSYSEQTSSSSDDSVNTGRTLIEPPQPATISGVANPQYNADVEGQKFSKQAKIYVVVTPSTTAPTNSGGVITYPAGTIQVYVGGGPNNGGTLVTDPIVSTLLTYNAYKETTVSGTTTVNKGLYDRQRGQGNTSTAGMVDLIELDINKLRDVVNQVGAASPDNSKKLTGLTTGNWNGIVYVEVAGAPSTNIATDSATSAVAGGTKAATNSRSLNTGLRLINGSTASAAMPSGSTDPGLTIATNTAVYILGNYNADGANATTTAAMTTPDDGNDGSAGHASAEKPNCIAGDSVTILSAAWNDSTSKSSTAPTSSASNEVAAAILAGLVPTDKDGTGYYSGGANNLPRFLEDWNPSSGRNTATIRGSLVSMFESRVATGKYNGSVGYYDPPNRNWGFDSIFKNGNYPPGTPKVMTYRRINYTDLTAAEYAAAKTAAIAGIASNP